MGEYGASRGTVSQFNSPLAQMAAMQQNSSSPAARMYDYGSYYAYPASSTVKQHTEAKEPICERVLTNEHGKPVSPIINKMEEEDMAEKKNFGLKDATLVLIIGWILSKLVNRWTGKSLDEMMVEYKAEFKEWLEK